MPFLTTFTPRLTDIGWEFIDDIVWTKPDYAAKNRNGGFFQTS